MRANLHRSITFVVIVVIVTFSLFSFSNCTKMHDIHWNTTNPIFRIDNTDHIIDVNKENKQQFEYDQVNIICPVYTPGTHGDDAEKYIIYNVSKEEYDTCRITNPNPRIIAVCDHPYKLMYFTITFRSFTPQPGGLEFSPGQDYYFISTSSKDDLHRRIGGRCSTHNMKVVFKVCCIDGHHHNNSTATTSRSFTKSTTTTTTTTTRTTSRSYIWGHTQTTTTTPSTTTLKTTSYKDIDVPSINIKATTKKTEEYDKHPNEVVKNEELTLNSATRQKRLHTVPIFLFNLISYLTTRLLVR